MPVPKRKRSRSRRDKRFANKGIKVKAFTKCQNCEEALMPHTACLECGYYKGIKVLQTKADRAGKRNVAKQAKSERAALKAPAASEKPAAE